MKNMREPTYFRFYARDFLIETECLTKSQRAYYALLTVSLHARGEAGIAVEDAKRALGMKAGSWRAFIAALRRSGFVELDERECYLRQPKVAAELQARAELSAARRAAGKASAAARRRRAAGGER